MAVVQANAQKAVSMDDDGELTPSNQSPRFFDMDRINARITPKAASKVPAPPGSLAGQFHDYLEAGHAKGIAEVNTQGVDAEELARLEDLKTMSDAEIRALMKSFGKNSAKRSRFEAAVERLVDSPRGNQKETRKQFASLQEKMDLTQPGASTEPTAKKKSKKKSKKSAAKYSVDDPAAQPEIPTWFKMAVAGGKADADKKKASSGAENKSSVKK